MCSREAIFPYFCGDSGRFYRRKLGEGAAGGRRAARRNSVAQDAIQRPARAQAHRGSYKPAGWPSGPSGYEQPGCRTRRPSGCWGYSTGPTGRSDVSCDGISMEPSQRKPSLSGRCAGLVDNLWKIIRLVHPPCARRAYARKEGRPMQWFPALARSDSILNQRASGLKPLIRLGSRP